MIMAECMETMTPQPWTWNLPPVGMAGVDNGTIVWA